MFAVFCPVYDTVGEYGAYYFSKFEGDVIKLIGKNANIRNQELLKDADTIFFTSHGEYKKMVDSELTEVINYFNLPDLSGKTIFFVNCNTAKLGEYIAGSNTIGYEGNFEWYMKNTSIEEDDIAKIFWDIQIKIACDILKGKDLKEIFELANSYYQEAIEKAKQANLPTPISETLQRDIDRFTIRSTGAVPPVKQYFWLRK